MKLLSDLRGSYGACPSASLSPRRFAPDAVPLPPEREYCDWRAARFPATARSWRARRWIARRVEAFAVGIRWCASPFLTAECVVRNFAELVHGQPHVAQRLNFEGFGLRRVNAYAPLRPVGKRLPFADADIEFLAGYCAAIPEALAALDAEMRAAVIARQGGEG